MELDSACGAAGLDSGRATPSLEQTDSGLEPTPQNGRISPEIQVAGEEAMETPNQEQGDREAGPEAEALMSQQVKIAPGQAAIELGSGPPLQPKRSKMDRVRGVRDAAKEGVTRGYTTAKQRVTCTCTKVTWRIIRLGFSLWQIADMVSDGFQTAKFHHLSSVSHGKLQIRGIVQYINSLKIFRNLAPQFGISLNLPY